MMQLRSTCAAGLTLVSMLLACGTSADGGASGPGTNNGALGGDGGVGTSGTIGASGNIGSTSGDPSGSTSGDPSSIPDGGACAAENADAARKPAYLFFVLDQSMSMSEAKCALDGSTDCRGGSPPACCLDAEQNRRWVPVTAALKAFVKDPQSKGIVAGMELFPSTTNFDSADPPAFCNASTYASDATKLDVTMRPLPDEPAFAAKMTPRAGGWGTPTRAVFKAMGPIVKKWATDHPDGKTAIVLLTDGYPQECSSADNNIANVASEIAGIKDAVPTYVIGVSDKTANLDELRALATAGGTELTLVDTSDPVKTQKAFLDRINEIRKSTFSCDVAIPAPPAGQTLDLGKINVTFTTGAGAKEPLAYDATCAGAKGWRFDSTDQPKKIELCTATCDAFTKDADGKLGVEFGCSRRDVDVK